MSRRNRSQAAFSLFAFQDIITAVTAIMILLVLILTLELVTRKHEASAADPKTSRAALTAMVASLEKLVGMLVATVPPDDPRPLARRTKAELERDVRIVEDQAAQAAADAEAAKAVEGRARALAAAAIARLQDADELRKETAAIEQEAARSEAEAKNIALENERETERLVQRRQELVEQPSPGAELVFNAPQDFDRQAWIVEVSEDGLTVVQLGTNKRQELGGDLEAGSRAAAWAAGLDPASDHALVLVRPSGVDREDAVRALLGDEAIPFGVDFIGEDQVVRDGTGEAKEAGDIPEAG
jgi:hypothetical protein